VLTGDAVDVLLSASDLLSRLSQVSETAVPAWLEEHAEPLEQMVSRLGEVRAGTWVAPPAAAPAPASAAATQPATAAATAATRITGPAPAPASLSVAPPSEAAPQAPAHDAAPPIATRKTQRAATPATPAPAVLVFESAGQRYGLDVADIVEVVPAVPLQPLPGTPPMVAGLCRYRGSLMPVLDVNQMLGGPPAARRYSTRIVVVRYRNQAGAEHLLGLLAERLDHGIDDAAGALTAAAVATPDLPWLGPLASTAGAVTQMVSVHDIVPEPLRNRLFTEA
jgi:chemotaxis-related protein WspB